MADQLLTGGEGELAEHCHPALRRNVAIFASGKVFVAQGRENDDGVSSVIALAERMGYRLDSEIKLVDRGVIERFYSTSRTVRGSDGNSSDDPESMRHAVYEVLDRASTMDGAGDVIIKRNGDVSRAYVMLDGVQRPLLKMNGPRITGESSSVPPMPGRASLAKGRPSAVIRKAPTRSGRFPKDCQKSCNPFVCRNCRRRSAAKN